MTDKVKEVLIGYEVYDHHGLPYQLRASDIEKLAHQLNQMLIEAEVGNDFLV